MMDREEIICKECGWKFETNIEEYIGYKLCPIHYEEFSLRVQSPITKETRGNQDD
jgi:hypothetical protein